MKGKGGEDEGEGKREEEARECGEGKCGGRNERGRRGGRGRGGVGGFKKWVSVPVFLNFRFIYFLLVRISGCSLLSSPS